MRLDRKSARKIALGRLQAMDDGIEGAMAALLKSPTRRLRKDSKAAQLLIETAVKTVHGDSMIGSGWSARSFTFFICETIHCEDSGLPNLLIKGWTINTRSGLQRGFTVAAITMHAMERLLERREDVDLIRLAQEEFNMNFVSRVVFGVNGVRLGVNETFDIQTHSGSARGIVGEDGVPVVKTWIKKRPNESLN